VASLLELAQALRAALASFEPASGSGVQRRALCVGRRWGGPGKGRPAHEPDVVVASSTRTPNGSNASSAP
jgi:hypothetical protein